MSYEEFFTALQLYTSMTSGSVSSYGRHPLYNAGVDGVEHSGHVYWVGADVRYLWHLSPGQIEKVRARFGHGWTPPPEIPLATREEYARRLGLKLIAEQDHDHLQPLDWRAG